MRICILGVGDVGIGILVDVCLAVDPFDRQPFRLEQPFLIRDQFAQTLKGRGIFKNQLFHF